MRHWPPAVQSASGGTCRAWTVRHCDRLRWTVANEGDGIDSLLACQPADCSVTVCLQGCRARTGWGRAVADDTCHSIGHPRPPARRAALGRSQRLKVPEPLGSLALSERQGDQATRRPGDPGDQTTRRPGDQAARGGIRLWSAAHPNSPHRGLVAIPLAPAI